MQVWLNERLVGELYVGGTASGEFYNVPVYDEEGYSTVTFEVVRRTARITDYEKTSLGSSVELGALLRARGVPMEASMVREPMTGDDTYRWQVLRATPEALEKIFSADEFVPDPDDDPDMDAPLYAKTAWAFNGSYADASRISTGTISADHLAVDAFDRPTLWGRSDLTVPPPDFKHMYMAEPILHEKIRMTYSSGLTVLKSESPYKTSFSS